MAENLWVEKYRPRKIDDCILTNELKETFKQFVKQKEIPNLLLSGTAGTGKTTVARALCEELGLDYIIINGSDDYRQTKGVRMLKAKDGTWKGFYTTFHVHRINNETWYLDSYWEYMKGDGV